MWELFLVKMSNTECSYCMLSKSGYGSINWQDFFSLCYTHYNYYPANRSHFSFPMWTAGKRSVKKTSCKQGVLQQLARSRQNKGCIPQRIWYRTVLRKIEWGKKCFLSSFQIIAPEFSIWIFLVPPLTWNRCISLHEVGVCLSEWQVGVCVYPRNSRSISFNIK